MGRWRSQTWNPFVQSPAFQDLARTAKVFGQTPSSLLEIKDWSVARELDVAAADFLIAEEMKRDYEREKRDREFWIRAFGGQLPEDEEGSITLVQGREP